MFTVVMSKSAELLRSVLLGMALTLGVTTTMMMAPSSVQAQRLSHGRFNTLAAAQAQFPNLPVLSAGDAVPRGGAIMYLPRGFGNNGVAGWYVVE